MALSKDQILQANDLPTKTVPVPEWGGDVIIRSLTGRDQEVLEKDKSKVWINLVLLSCVDEDGQRLFSDADASALKRKSGGVLLSLAKEIAAFNGMTKEEVEDLAKNSESGQSEDSGSS